MQAKLELLGNSVATLFPIQWNEPFGLVMIEAMACGTPVLSLSGGSVEEVVEDGISGYVCHWVGEMAAYARETGSRIRANAMRQYAGLHFPMQRMATDYARLYAAISSPVLTEVMPELTAEGGHEPAAA